MDDWQVNAEPFRIKMVEPIRMISKKEREKLILSAGYNIFNLKAEDVYIDLLTDSGTSVMSQYQWAALILGDESYAGSRSFYKLKESVSEITGYDYVLPTHQGRAAEHILTEMLVKPGTVIPGNMHFDSARGHMQLKGGKPLDLVIDEGLRTEGVTPFKGNIDMNKLHDSIKEYGAEKIPFILITITCNNNGGQPVSLANIRAVREVSKQFNIPIFFDAARFAENCYFIHKRESGYQKKAIKEIAREVFSYGDGCVMSAKKDGLVNIGGFMAFNNLTLYEQASQLAIIYEGFPTYGGLSGRDLAAMAVGLQEVLEIDYLSYRVQQIAYLAKSLQSAGVPIMEPSGGHAVYLDAKKFLPHIPQSKFPGQAIVVSLYIESGIRAIEIGTSVFTEKDPDTGEIIYPELELVRLTIPRRVYTNSHIDYVAQSVIEVFKNRNLLNGLKIVYETPVLRHFTCRFEML